jgi:hypothetical protein
MHVQVKKEINDDDLFQNWLTIPLIQIYWILEDICSLDFNISSLNVNSEYLILML